MSNELENFANEVQKELDEVSSVVPSLSESKGVDSDLLDQMRHLESLMEVDPSVIESPEYQDLLAAIQGQQGQPASTATEDDSEEDEDLEEDDEEDDEELENEFDNPFESEKPKKKLKEIPINFEVPKEFVDILEKNFGVKELPTFLNSAMTWRHQAQEAAELKRTQEAIEEDLNAMPYEIRAAISAWSEGEDYLASFKNATRLDYDSDFTKQSTDNLVQHYLPEQYDELIDSFNKEEISEEELDKQLNLLGKTTRKLFDRDKQALSNQRDQYASKAAEQQKAFKKSAQVSIDSFSKAYPDFSKSELNRIRTTLVEGKLDNLFFNPDGTYTEQAAEYIAFALNGKKLLEGVKRNAKREGKMEEAMEIVDKSPKKLSKSKGGMSTNKIDMNAISHLSGLGKKDPYS